jgi:spore germination cell wall hydrolase CwlJ-like protein
MLKTGAKRSAGHGPRRAVASLGLLAACASCVPSGSDTRPAAASAAPPAAEAALLAQAPPPAPLPLELQPVAPDTAMALNAAIPLSQGYNPPARPFALRTRTAIDRMRSLECLTAAIYYEAASESDDGQRAVAQVVLNRVRHPTYPNSVCGVVYQGSERSTGCQFSFTCDGSLLRTPSIAGWARARRIASAALAGSVYAPVGHATHYHTHQVLPHWAPSLTKLAVIGAHIFYRWTGAWGTPPAFRQAHAGVEPLPGPKPPRLVALPVASEAAFQADLAAVLAAGRQLAAPPAVGLVPTPEAQEKPQQREANNLPGSQVLEQWRYSGVPLDQLPPGAK